MDEYEKINEANLVLLEKVIALAKEDKIKARITCGAVSVELGDSIN